MSGKPSKESVPGVSEARHYHELSTYTLLYETLSKIYLPRGVVLPLHSTKPRVPSAKSHHAGLCLETSEWLAAVQGLRPKPI
ncbi:hypothetical protein MAJ_11498, partial [Metarhizium majus ARSEF 297]